MKHDLPFDPTYGYTPDSLLQVPSPEGPADFADFWKKPCNGSGESVRSYSKTHPEVIDVLRYFDSATAARHIHIPVFVSAAHFAHEGEAKENAKILARLHKFFSNP